MARSVDSANAQAIRVFFETFFVPHQIFKPDGTDNGLVTGYYEPLLNGSRKRGGPYQTPLYKVPDDLLTVDLGGIYPELKNMRLRGSWLARRSCRIRPGPRWRSPARWQAELIWVDDPIEAFFLEVQGSGRVQLAETGKPCALPTATRMGIRTVPSGATWWTRAN